MLTPAQIDQFHRDGFLIIRNLFSGRELAQLRAAGDAVTAEGIAGRGERHLYRNIGGARTYYRSEGMWDRDAIFRAATVNPRLLACIGQCTGPHEFLPVNDSFVCKLPRGNVPIEWHQDPPNGDPNRLTSPDIPNFDVDIYLDDSTLENGCVWGIPGHHLVGHVELSQFTQEQLFACGAAVPMEMKPGDVLFHTISGPHGSIGNLTDTTRRIFYVHYMAQAVLEECYPDWSSKRGFSEAGKQFVASMLETRRELGYDGIEGSAVEWTGHGFRFAGQPASAPYPWRALKAALTPAEIARQKRLQVVHDALAANA